MTTKFEKNDLLDLVQKNVKLSLDLSGFTEDVIDTFLDQWLEGLVNDTDSPIDNMIKASLMPTAKAELLKLVAKVQKNGPINLFDLIEKIKDKSEE